MKLEGIRVIDLTQFLPGPHLTMMMADHGAEVIKIENPREGEPTRKIGPVQAGQSVYFRNTQRGKRSVNLDLKSEPGREALLRLAETADVLVESFRPGTLARLGLGAAAVRARVPRLIYCSISAFGQSGPMAGRPAHDLAILSHAGMAALNADEQGRPIVPAMPAADMLGSSMALSGILMALLRRERTGRGDALDISMFDAVLSWTVNVTAPLFAEGRVPVRERERTLGGAAFYGVYAAGDGRYVSLGGSEIKFARNLLTALGREDLIPLCQQPPGPAQQPVKDFLARTFATRTQAEWVEWIRDKDVCFAAVRSLDEVYADPLVAERGMLLRDDAGLEHIGIPIKFTGEPGQVHFHAPEQGEHSEPVLRELGYSAEELAVLRAQGVI
jgi:crotonobetainyl-CoA:carnitine CoA-transferase CaiB-like acyl-CoA transferase